MVLCFTRIKEDKGGRRGEQKIPSNSKAFSFILCGKVKKEGIKIHQVYASCTAYTVSF